MQTVIPLPPPSTIAVSSKTERYPVRRIWCVGRNYADHAREMGHDPNREPPFFFQKPADAVVENNSVLPFPVQTDNLHHEVELVVALGKGGQDIAVEHALDYVYGYAVGLDMTRRDLQNAAKKLQRPWEMGKGFDQSCPTSAIVPAAAIGHPSSGAIWLKVNGEVRQQSDLSQQIWRVEESISYLSKFVALEPGDLILNGTPSGVGPCVAGDRLEACIEGVGSLNIAYTTR